MANSTCCAEGCGCTLGTSFATGGNYSSASFNKSVNNIAERYNIYENDVEYVIAIDVPGVKKENITISLEKAILSIKAKRTETLSGYTKKTRDVWTPIINTSVAFLIPHDYLSGSNPESKITASIEDGILYVTVSKPDVPPAITIKID